MAKTTDAPVQQAATIEIAATAAMTLVMAGNSVYGITPAPPSGQNLVTWSVHNLGTGSCSIRWDDLGDAIYNDSASLLMPQDVTFGGLQARRLTIASDNNGGTVTIAVQPPAYR